MKRIIFITAAMLISSLLFGQGKLVSSSQPRTPIWVKNDVEKYDVVKVSAASNISLKAAKEQALSILHNKVVDMTTKHMMQFAMGTPESTVRNNIEKSAFVKGISESSALDSYWEERYVKKSKSTTYYYYFLYNFNETEIGKISLEINKENSATQKAIDEL